MKRILMIVVPVALVAVAATYLLVGRSGGAKAKERVAGEVYVLPKDFVVNLADDRFAKVSVALVLSHGQKAAAGGEGAQPPDGYGTLPQEALVRAIVTDELTGKSSRTLIGAGSRDGLEVDIRKRILKSTDVKVDDVKLTDIAVQ